MKTWKSLSRSQRILELLCLVLLAGMFLALLAGWGSIPEQIPGHYNGEGVIDRWTGKWELLLMLFFTVFMYLLLTVCTAVCLPSVRKMELPWAAMAWLAAVKLVVLAGFAYVTFRMAQAQPLSEGFTKAFVGAAVLPCAGFIASSLRFARRQRK